MLNIRPARVRFPCDLHAYHNLTYSVYAYVSAAIPEPGSTPITASWILQVEDLSAMQACNLQNLPENYTMRYCTYLQELRSKISEAGEACLTSMVAKRRSLLSPLTPTALLRSRGTRTDRRIHPCQNVSLSPPAATLRAPRHHRANHGATSLANSTALSFSF